MSHHRENCIDSSGNEVKTCQVEVIVGGLSLTYCVPSSWRLCQGKEYAGFEVDGVPNTEILESMKSQYPVFGIQVCIFSVEEKPEEDVLLQVQQQPELEGLEVQFLDGIVVVRMPSGPDSDRAHLFQKQFDCYLARRGLPAKWLSSSSSSLYSFSTCEKRFAPDFAVVDKILASKARMEQVQPDGDISAMYKDVKLLVAIEFQSKTDRIQDMKVRARDMISVCADLVICFLAYKDGESCRGLEIIHILFANRNMPYSNEHRDISCMKASKLVEVICLAVQDGDVALAEEAINYLDDMDLECGGLSLLSSAATAESIEYDSYVIVRSTRNKELCDIFEEYGCCFGDPKQLTLQAIYQSSWFH